MYCSTLEGDMMFDGIEAAGIRGLNSFDPSGEASSVSACWEARSEEFDGNTDNLGLFVNGAMSVQLIQWRALLMYSAGASVWETFKTLPETGGKSEYAMAVAALLEAVMRCRQMLHFNDMYFARR